MPDHPVITASSALDGTTTLQALTGQVPDISHFFHFCYKVVENEPDHRFPSQSNEKRGYWVGFANNAGDHLTWMVLTDETQQLLPDLLLEVPTKLLLTSGWTHEKRRINHKMLTSEVFVYGRPHPDGSNNHISCPPSTLMTIWGALFCFLWKRMGRGREVLYLRQAQV